MSYMRFCVMDVGQGSANYIELREDDDSLTAAAIVDIGSEQWKTKAGKPAAAWVSEQLSEMDGSTSLDAVILSHSDSDHVNLIPSVLEHFATPREKPKARKVLTIKKVIFGGVFSKYQKGKQQNFLYQLDAYRPKGKDSVLTQLDNNFSSFSGKSSTWTPLATIGGKIKLWALSANTDAEKIPLVGRKRLRAELPDGGFAINTRSIVVVADFAGKKIIATGDATGLTLAHCNELLDRQDVKKQLGGATYMITLPHHGSDTTLYDLTGSGAESDAGKCVVQKFTKLVNADTISASAGEKSTFRHPAARVIKDFGGNLLSDPQYIDNALQNTNQHFYTAYFPERTLSVSSGAATSPHSRWPVSERWYTARTTENVYTTDYFAPPTGRPIPDAFPWEAREEKSTVFKPVPPRAISWAFFVMGDGTTKMEVAVERTGAHAEYWAAVEAVHGPLPSEGIVVLPSAPLRDTDSAEPPPAPPPAECPPPHTPPPPGPSRLRQLP
ncbi:hypothetical protein [Streptomyces spirodelae]|uniref:MBL fold metallo-hydrolase n=1 Tax=Streptomyces spirodelae TaxID=2812904 RepID=A0ABS3WTG4_9ACTN|nr:hypothetical protein [Streptomyces spirodelae]MBO8186409.1 hypothetical protein [Streptomyces spirodelae]